MLFQQSQAILAAATLGNLFTTAAGVTLNQYTRANCNGNRAFCANIGPRICCEARGRVFASGSCTGCTSTDFHITWVQSGRNYCGRSAAATNGGGCISGSSNLRGHSWCRLCGTKRDGLGDELPCTETVEPTLLQIDNKWFSLNETIPADHKDSLWTLWNNEASAAEIPDEFLLYEIEAPAEAAELPEA